MIVGQGGHLNCEFEREGESISSLKWYIGLNEFYRWSPKSQPSVMTFPPERGFRINEAESREGRVKIQNITLAAAGKLRCEVSLFKCL